MDKLQNTLVNALYKIRKQDTTLEYPIPATRLREIIDSLLSNYKFHCKSKPKIKSKSLDKKGIIENTSTILELVIVYLNSDNTESSPTKITLYFDSYLNQDDIPEYAISGRFRNKFKDAIYRPMIISDESNIICYVNNILNDLSHKI